MELTTHSRSAAAAADFAAEAARLAADVDSSLAERIVEASVEVDEVVVRPLEELGSAAAEVVEGGSAKDVVSNGRKMDSEVVG